MYYSIVVLFLLEPTDYCVEDMFTAQCPEGEYIVILGAKYGRMSLGKCVPVDLGKHFHSQKTRTVRLHYYRKRRHNLLSSEIIIS